MASTKYHENIITIMFIIYSFALCSIFVLETRIHIEHIHGFTILAHSPNAKEIFATIKKTFGDKSTSIGVYLGPDEICHVAEPEFKEQCTTYFKKNFKTLAELDPLILPWKIPEDSMIIESTMDCWCKKTNLFSSVKGLVLHNFSLTKCLALYGIKNDILRVQLNLKNFSLTPISVVYNPDEKAILLIRKAESKKLITDMALTLNDLKMFILLFSDELMGSGVKLIPLVVNDGKHKFDCDTCLCHVFSVKEFQAFESRWKKERNYFQTKSEGKITKDFSTDFIAKATSLMAATYVYHDCIPKFTSKTCGEMDSLAVLLTREQMEIFYSQDKHIIIKGGFGCGKTIVAAAILRKICQILQKHEKLFFICYDRRSALISQMTKNEKGNKNSKVTLIHNKEGQLLSVIMKDILQKKKRQEKVNFVVDEYDGEDLDESEVKTLNNMFANNESLKDAFIVLIAQPTEKERTINNTLRKGNMFQLLETMKVFKLTLVMRNTTEIHKLIVATREILSKKKTVYVHEEYRETDLEEKNSLAKFTKKLAERDQAITEKPLVQSSSREKYLPDHSEEITMLRIDEAQAIAGYSTVTGDSRSETVSKFTYAEANETGHDINTEKPTLFEIEDRPEFQKILNLIAIFEKLNIRKKEHVVLHFDTVNEIPSTLEFIFEHHFKIYEGVTNKYEELASSKKSVLVCSYLTFRGLEHPEITVLIDRDIYFLQHYLVETLARCTSNLSVVILKNSETLDKVTGEWKTKRLVNEWKTKCTKNTQKDDFTFNPKNDKTIEMSFKHEYYKDLEEAFIGTSTIKDKTVEYKLKILAETFIKQKR